jgi:ribonuclease D
VLSPGFHTRSPILRRFFSVFLFHPSLQFSNTPLFQYSNNPPFPSFFWGDPAAEEGFLLQYSPGGLGDPREGDLISFMESLNATYHPSCFDPSGWDRLRQGLSRDEINALPIRRYTGPVRLFRPGECLDGLTEALSRETVLGFDTESRPSFKKGESFPPSLVQLAGRDTVYLVQITPSGIPEELIALLSDPGIVKAGVAPVDDLKKLREISSFEPQAFADLAAIARKLGFRNHGLRGLAAALLGFRVSKAAQCSNWSSPVLRPDQIAYAAMDAWVSREVFLFFDRLAPVPPVAPDTPCSPKS